jgi:hypothetical protein
MSGRPSMHSGAVDPAELGKTDPADLAEALETARRLEAAIDEAPVWTGAGFSDRVMAAIANEPAPAPTGFLAPLRRLGLVRGFGTSVRQAWGSIGAPGRPTFARAAALAYVLAIAIAGTSLAGAATIGVAGALGIIGPHPQATPTTAPQTIAPDQSQRPSAESEPPGPEVTEEPSDGPDASDDHGGATGTDPSDDSGGNSGPGSTSTSGGDGGLGSDDGSSATATPGSGGGSDDGGGSSTPKPTQTVRPTQTPKPTSTSGSSGGSTDGGSSGGGTAD